MFIPLISLNNCSETSEEIWFLMVCERRWSKKSLNSFKSASLLELAFLKSASYWDNLKLFSWVRVQSFLFTYLLFAFGDFFLFSFKLWCFYIIFEILDFIFYYRNIIYVLFLNFFVFISWKKKLIRPWKIRLLISYMTWSDCSFSEIQQNIN